MAGKCVSASVPALIDTIKTTTGGPRIRSGFVLGAMGAEAKDAIPALKEIMKIESPANQVRLADILTQIDPSEQGVGGAGSPKQVRLSAQSLDAAAAGIGADWPQFHGPLRDSICRERGLLSGWPQEGPKLLWQLEGLGIGFSSVSIAGLMALVGATIFPNLVPALGNAAWSLTIENASSSPLTLKTMLIIALIGMPVVILYTAWLYKTFAGKTTAEEHY